MRTYAVWEKSKRIAWSLTAVLLVIGISALVFIAKSFRDVHFKPSPAPIILPGCFLVQANRLIWLDFFVLTLFETLILGLTLYKIIRDWKDRGSDLAGIIYRDGIAFYVFLLVITIVTMITLNVVPDALALSLTHIHRVLHATLTGRIILNLRAASSQSQRPTSQRLDLIVERADLEGVTAGNVVFVPLGNLNLKNGQIGGSMPYKS